MDGRENEEVMDGFIEEEREFEVDLCVEKGVGEKGRGFVEDGRVEEDGGFVRFRGI